MQTKAKARTAETAAVEFKAKLAEWHKLGEQWFARFEAIRARRGDGWLPRGWREVVDRYRNLTRELFAIACRAEIDAATTKPFGALKVHLKAYCPVDRRWPQYALVPRAFRPDAAAWRDDCLGAAKRIVLILDERAQFAPVARKGSRRGPRPRGGDDTLAMRVIAALAAEGKSSPTPTEVAKAAGFPVSRLYLKDDHGDYRCRRFHAWLARQKQRRQRDALDRFERRSGERSEFDPVARVIAAEEGRDMHE